MKNSRIFLFAALGAAFWFQAALIIRFCGTTVFTENNPNLILFYLLAIPFTVLSLFITKRISKLPHTDLLKPVAVMTFTATFLDAVALTWFRQLYSQSFEVALYGAAWILWAVGLGLLFSFYLELKGNKTKQKVDPSSNVLDARERKIVF
jgi:hypothetical protein